MNGYDHNDRINQCIADLKYALALIDTNDHDLAEFAIIEAFEWLNSANYSEFSEWSLKTITKIK